MQLHIPNEYFDRQIANEAAESIYCMVGFGPSKLYPDHTQVTIAGDDAAQWQTIYIELFIERMQHLEQEW
jgi:hypothetical protein